MGTTHLLIDKISQDLNPVWSVTYNLSMTLTNQLILESVSDESSIYLLVMTIDHLYLLVFDPQGKQIGCISNTISIPLGSVTINIDPNRSLHLGYLDSDKTYHHFIYQPHSQEVISKNEPWSLSYHQTILSPYERLTPYYGIIYGDETGTWAGAERACTGTSTKLSVISIKQPVCLEEMTLIRLSDGTETSM